MPFGEAGRKPWSVPDQADSIAKSVTEVVGRNTEMVAFNVEEAVEKGVRDLMKKEPKTREHSTPGGLEPQEDSDHVLPRPIRKLTKTESPMNIGESAYSRKMTLRGIVPQPSIAMAPQPAKHVEIRTSNDMFHHCREYDHMMTVEFKLTFLKINDIDTLSQQFEAEVYVQAKWQEPAFVGMDHKELDTLLPGDLWDPHLTVLNIAGEFDQEKRSYVVRYEEGYEAPVVLHRWRFKGLFRKALELRHFPFDVQDLTIQLSTERSFDEIKMAHDTHQLSSVNTRTFQDSQEWSIYTHVQCDYRNTTVQYASSTIHPILVFSCRVRRRVGYFIWNIVFIVFLVLVLSLLSVSIDPTTSDRLANTMTLFLTMVAFKLVVKQSLPTISYLTYLDFYVLGSLMYLVLYAMENSAMNSLGRGMDHELVEAYDEFFCMFLAALLILFHLGFVIHIQVTALKRHREMIKNDRRYADIYVLGSLMYLVLYAMENSAMNSLGRGMDHELVEAYDEFFCMFLAALLILFHLGFVIHIQVTALKRHREMIKNDRRYADIYVLGSLMYLVLYAMENSAMNSLGRGMDHELVEAYDEFFCMFLAALLILFHLGFVIHIQVTALKRHREMIKNDRRYADIYVLGSLMYLVLYAMENSAMNSLGRGMDHELVEAYDEFFCMFLAALLILFHLGFVIHIQVTALKRHREMIKNDRRYALQARSLARKHGAGERVPSKGKPIKSK